MAMDPDELEQLVNAITKGFATIQSSTPSSKKEFSDFDVNLRSTSKKLQDLATVINNADIKTAKGSEERSEAEKLFVRTLKGKLDDIARSSGTVKDKLEKLEDTLKEVDGATEEYKDKVRDSLREQIKYTEATRIQTEKTRIQTDTTEKYNIALNNFGKSLAPMANLVGGIVKSYQAGGSQIGMAGSLLATEIGIVGSTASSAGAGLMGVGAAASLSSSKLTRFAGGLATVGGLGLDLFGKGLSAVATKALPILTAEADKVLSSFQSISSTGAVFGNGILGMQSAALDAGLTIDQLSNVLKESKGDIADAGVGIVEGTKKIGETFKADAKSGGLLRESLDRLGYSLEEQANLVANTMGIIGRSGKSIKDVIPADLARTTLEYANSLKVIAGASGKDAKEIQEKTRQRMNTLGLQSEMSKRRAAGDTGVEDRFQDVINASQRGGSIITDVATQILGPLRQVTGNTALVFQNFGAAGQDFIKTIEQIRDDQNINPEDRRKLINEAVEKLGGADLQKSIDKFAAAQSVAGAGGQIDPRVATIIEKLTESNIALKSAQPGSFDESQKNIAVQQAKAKEQAEKNKKDMEEAERTGKKYVKTLVDPNDVTAGLLGVRDAAQEVATSIQEKFLNSNVLPEFAKALTTATQNVKKLIDDYGKGIGDAAGAGLGWLDTILKYAIPIASVFTIIGGTISGVKAIADVIKSWKGPTSPPTPGAGDIKPGGGPPPGKGGPGGATTGGFKVDLNDLKNKTGAPSSTNTENHTPGGSKPTTKPGIKGKFGAVLNSAAAMAGPVLEKSNSLMAGASAVTAALEGNIGGLVESLKDIAAGTKVAGAEAVKPAATTAATEAVKPVAKVAEAAAKPATTAASTLAKEGTEVLAKDGAKLAAKEAATLGAKSIGKSILKKLPGIGFLVGLGLAGQRAMEGDWAGAGLEFASGAASTFPGPGTAASVAFDATLAAKDAGLFGKKEKATTVTPIAEPPVKLPENKPVVPTVPKVAGASVFDRTPGQSPALDPRTNEEKDKFTKAIAEGKSLKSVLDEIKASEKVIASNNPSDPNYVSSKVEPVVVEPDSSNPSNPNYVSTKVEPVAAALDPSNPSNPNYEPPRAEMASAVLTGSTASPQVLEEIKNTFANRVKEVAAREADITRTGMLPTQNVAPNNPQVPSDLNAKITEIVAEADKAKAAAVNALTATPSKSTTDDVVAAIEKLAAQFGRAVGLLDDISSHSGSTASNTRKQLQGQQ